MAGIPAHKTQPDAAARPRWQGIALYVPTAVGTIFSAPFRADPEWIISVPASQREGRRRAAFLRLILSCLLVLCILVLFPAAVLGNAAVASIWRLGLVTLLAAIGLLLNARGYTIAAGVLFISGSLVFVADYLVTNPDGLDLQAILTLTLLSVFILIAGLILPGWASWSMAGVMVAVTIASVFWLPLAPPLRATLADPIQIRFAVAGPLILLHLSVAVFSWIAARSNKATVQAVSRAFTREQELSQLKDQFITNVNHELRTPLMAMDGYIKLLRLRNQALSPERRAELIEKASRAGNDLVALVTSILETQRLEQSAAVFTPAPVHLRETVESAIRLAAAQIETNKAISPGERALHLQIPEDLVVWAEQVRLQQIFTNLLSNAVKYSPSGTPIEVQAWVVPSRWDASQGIREGLRSARSVAEVTIRDFGFGIPPEQIPLLFERFVRLPRDLASNIAGNGLGLYLCRTFAEAMAGKIWVESSGVAGEGSTFHLQIPLPPPR
ncbi:MAG TPA: HAMP domain-containing sensor histidine kinase [Ktedonobacterales bacterium]|nr:HAMP domain-containing sensor histidine kinase [Ktedonobacterales bacterium]